MKTLTKTVSLHLKMQVQLMRDNMVWVALVLLAAKNVSQLEGFTFSFFYEAGMA